MFDDWRKRRDYASKIAANEEKLAALNNENDPDLRQRAKLRKTLSQQKENQSVFESQVAVRKAQKRAIEIPLRRDKPAWWQDDNDEYGGVPPEALTVWLTETGRTALLKLVAEDRKRNVEWWVKILTPLLGFILSALGLIVALVTVSRR